MKEWLAIGFVIAACAFPFAGLAALCIYYELRRARLIKLGRSLEGQKPPGFEVLPNETQR